MNITQKQANPIHQATSLLISVVVPLYNEEQNIDPLLLALRKVADLLPDYRFEFIFVNDGSTDDCGTLVEHRAHDDERIRYIEFSRNFGKEAATTAGIRESRGDAVMLIDADLQHPPELIPEFVAKWEEGGEVIIGVRKHSMSEGFTRRIGSHLFYAIIERISETNITPRATDFRLLDRVVVNEFIILSEHNRMTRGLIDWLGFRREYIEFDANEREFGIPAYRISKLIKLALASFVAHSFFPLRLAGMLGVVITLLSGLLGLLQLLDKYYVQWGFNFSGPAQLATLTIFLVGIVLVSIGLLSFYIENIFRDTQSRPLYVIRKGKRREENSSTKQ